MPLSSEYFQPRKSSKDGFKGQCCTCVFENRKTYRIKNRETLLEEKKKHYKNNKDIFIERANKYYKDNKKYVSEQHKQYRAINKDIIAKNLKTYYQSNTEKLKEYRKMYWHGNKDKEILNIEKYRSRKSLLPSTFTIEQWQITKQYFNNCCAYCGKEKSLHQDHFIALSKGGEYTHNNIICVCKSCNSSKNNSNFFVWYAKQEFYNKKREQKIFKFLHYNNGNQQMAF